MMAEETRKKAVAKVRQYLCTDRRCDHHTKMAEEIVSMVEGVMDVDYLDRARKQGRRERG